VAENQAARGSLTASVAASTSDAVLQLGDHFREATGIEVRVNAGPSNGLAAQILQGAPADLFLSASAEWADSVDKAGLSAARADLLGNRLVVVVPKGNPAGVNAPEDLARDAVKKLALASESVPAGAYAEQALTNLGLLQHLNEAGKIVRGQDVRAALAYVERGEAEAGIVYATDVQAGAKVETACGFDPASHDKIVYVLVLIKRDAENPTARRFYEFLQSREAAAMFAKLGFVPLAADDKR
jgi:molybdate transport system substrate-binding protein